MFLMNIKARESFLAQLGDTENWLYDEGENQQRQIYVDRLTSLKVIWSLVINERF